MPPSAVSWSPTGDLAFANLTVPGPLPTIPTADLYWRRVPLAGAVWDWPC